MIDYLKELNTEQYNVVSELEGTALVIAGAGTGKTKTLTMRAARMIDTGIKPENILTLTFTTKAAREMKIRLFRLLGDASVGITACTYHSFCANIIRQNANLVGLKSNYNIIDNPEQAIKKLLNARGYKKKQASLMPKPSIIYSLFTNELVKNDIIEVAIKRDFPDFYDKSKELREIFDEFKQYKLDHNVVDYTDLLILCNQLLENNPDVARGLAKKYQYIMVDEFQDSNNLQCKLLKLLLSDVHNNLMVVGDDMQSIYAFQGANYKNILSFPNQFAPCRMNILEKNYRSTQGILDLANAIIVDAPYKFNKNLCTDNIVNKKPIIKTVFNNFDEVESILYQIRDWVSFGIDIKDIAILVRNSYQLNLLESELLKEQIPYQKYGGIKFFEKAHIKDTFSFFRVIANYADELAWLRILPLIPGLGDASAEKITKDILVLGYDALIQKKYQGKKYSIWLEKLHNLMLAITRNKNGQTDTYGNKGCHMQNLDTQMEVLKNGYLNELFEEVYPEDYSKKLQEYDLLFTIAKDYDDMIVFLEDIQLNGTPIQSTDKDNCLTISTIHSAKGLEWECVILMDAIEGSIPSSKSIQSNDLESIEEERRLLYVAITRAKKQLIIYVPKNYNNFGNVSSSTISRFLSTSLVRSKYTI